MEEVAEEGDGDFDEDKDDDDHLEAGGVLVVHLAGKDLVELMDHVEALVEDLCAFGDVEVVSGSAVEGFELGVFPEEFWGVEGLTVQVDEVALDEDFSHFAGDVFAGKGDFTFVCELEGDRFGVLDGFLDELFEGGEFDRLSDAMGNGEFG